MRPDLDPAVLADLLAAVRRIRHRIAHWLGWNGGSGVSGIHGNAVWVGFRCAGCGRVSHYEPRRRLALQQEHADHAD